MNLFEIFFFLSQTESTHFSPYQQPDGNVSVASAKEEELEKEAIFDLDYSILKLYWL